MTIDIVKFLFVNGELNKKHLQSSYNKKKRNFVKLGSPHHSNHSKPSWCQRQTYLHTRNIDSTNGLLSEGEKGNEEAGNGERGGGGRER